jgi:formiminotetrahydrofolate cyclodeaminase
LAQAYRLPKSTPEEIEIKEKVMEEALKSAVQPPILILETCAEVVPLIAFCAEKGSVVAVSDAGVAASLCRAAIEGASLNVFINTQIMKDRVYAETLNNKARTLLTAHVAATNEIFRSVASRLGA